jgi:hypothetical protein
MYVMKENINTFNIGFCLLFLLTATGVPMCNILMVIKLRRVRWAERVALTGEMRNRTEFWLDYWRGETVWETRG